MDLQIVAARIKKAFIYCAVPLFLTGGLQADEDTRAKIKRFVMDVALGTEFTNKKEVVSRWVRAPKISIFGVATEQQKGLVKEVIESLNPVLKPHIGNVQLVRENFQFAEIKIYFASLDKFERIAREHYVKVQKDNLGYFYVFWDAKHVLHSAIVLIASDKLEGAGLRHFLFEEMTQSFGLARDSEEFPDSIFYQKEKNGGNTLKHSELDLQFISWFYQHASPGDDRQKLSEKFDATWPE